MRLEQALPGVYAHMASLARAMGQRAVCHPQRLAEQSILGSKLYVGCERALAGATPAADVMPVAAVSVGPCPASQAAHPSAMSCTAMMNI